MHADLIDCCTNVTFVDVALDFITLVLGQFDKVSVDHTSLKKCSRDWLGGTLVGVRVFQRASMTITINILRHETQCQLSVLRNFCLRQLLKEHAV